MRTKGTRSRFSLDQILLTFFYSSFYPSICDVSVCPCPSCPAPKQKWNYRWFFNKGDSEVWWILEKAWTANSSVSDLLLHPLYSMSQGNAVNNRNSISHHFPTFLTCRNHFLLLSGLIAKEIEFQQKYRAPLCNWIYQMVHLYRVHHHGVCPSAVFKMIKQLNAVFSQKILHESRNYDRLI